ncbi:MAG TPA: hypothetical protein VGM51_09585 [Armatimonadota bacterium]|jgi:uncharacterized protein YwbE
MVVTPPLDIIRNGYALLVELSGVTAVGTANEGTVKGLITPDKSDPHGIDAEGDTNWMLPNRFHFLAIDPGGVLQETHTYTIRGNSYTCVDVDPSLSSDQVACVRAVLTMYGRE